MKKICRKIVYYPFLLLLPGLLACTEAAEKETAQTDNTAVVYENEKQAPASAAAGDKVVAVKDGDTIELLRGKETIKVRLQGVDAPEKKQAYGEQAKQFTSDLVFGKNVKLIVHNTDRYGRTVGTIILPDGRSLNEELVKNGFAWHYKAYSKDVKLANLEADARRFKRGLWADKNPIAPWDYRKGKRSSSGTPTAVPSSQPTTNSSNTVWLCNSKGSDVYHVDKNCAGLKRCKSEIIAVNKTAAEKEYGRRAAKDCQ
ncbi:MAG: thermonuclease family protein [Hymenobacteraceae bacterium]|nr:thermonuclease family protein [Hymenobacteraceae bacterium]MDX5396634.1 thermonuclease family protein [Hymenobacteraceae bacterium]MDX5442826.1 thermonuclease family protein [Hymenobacteraceae bacterium]MDX5512701.1 thermonuclease family protein [Hymenobacteraceae bacterium]